MNPILSIVVPCYKQGDYVAETLDSIRKQTFQDWECIVVNDGSPDNSSEIVKEYVRLDSRIKLIETENRGVSAARNTGIKASSGKYILPLDADDIILPEYARLAVEYLEKHPETKLVYCEARMFGEINKYWELPDYQWDKFIFNNSIFCPSVSRRSDFDKTPGYNESMRKGWEDWDFLLGFLDKDDIVYRIPKVLLLYRIKSVSKSTEVLDNYKDLAKQLIDNHPDVYRKYLFSKMAYISTERHSSTEKLDMAVGHVITKPVRLFRKLIQKFK